MLQHFDIDRNYNSQFILPTLELIKKFGIIAAKVQASYKGSWETGEYVYAPDRVLTLSKGFSEQEKIDFLADLASANSLHEGVIYHTDSTWSFLDSYDGDYFWAYVEYPDINTVL